MAHNVLRDIGYDSKSILVHCKTNSTTPLIKFHFMQDVKFINYVDMNECQAISCVICYSGGT